MRLLTYTAKSYEALEKFKNSRGIDDSDVVYMSLEPENGIYILQYYCE